MCITTTIIVRTGGSFFRTTVSPAPEVSLTEGQITEVSGYLFARPTDSKPVPKNSFVTRVGDLGCGVGYYK